MLEVMRKTVRLRPAIDKEIKSTECATSKGSFTLTAATATERMDCIGPYGLLLPLPQVSV